MISVKLIGLLAELLTTSSFIPQVIKTVKTKDTSGISLFMYLIFTIGIFLWILYGIFLIDIPLIIANSVSFIFALIILIYKLIYH